jgi:hypothetical protein
LEERLTHQRQQSSFSRHLITGKAHYQKVNRLAATIFARHAERPTAAVVAAASGYAATMGRGFWRR